MNGCVVGWINGWMYEWMDGWVGLSVDGWNRVGELKTTHTKTDTKMQTNLMHQFKRMFNVYLI